jgi:hypothetical protein
MTFIDVLVDILDCLDRDADFDIDVTVILGTEERIMGNNIMIGKCMWRTSWWINCMCSAIVWSCNLGVAILSESGLLTESLWIVLSALSILHALGTTGTMQHAGGDSLV